MQIISSPSFEPPVSGWTLGGRASIVDDTVNFVVDGHHALKLFAERLVFGDPAPPGTTASSFAQQTLEAEPGDEYQIRIPYIAFNTAGPASLVLTIVDGAQTTTWTLDHPENIGIQVWEVGVYVALTASLVFTLSTPIPPADVRGAGYWIVDALSMESVEVIRRREIREALVAAISIVPGVAKAEAGIVAIEKIQDFPHVQVQHGSESKAIRTLTVKDCTVEYLVGIVDRTSDEGDRAASLDELCGAIETAIEKNDDGAGNSAPFLGLAYIRELMVEAIDPEEVPELVARQLSLWVMRVRVEYRHVRRAP